MATHGEKRWPPAGRFDGRLRGAFHGHRQLTHIWPPARALLWYASTHLPVDAPGSDRESGWLHIAWLPARISDLLYSILNLGLLGSHADAAALVRVMADHLIVFAWLAADRNPPQRYKAWLRHCLGQTRRLGDHVERLGGGSVALPSLEAISRDVPWLDCAAAARECDKFWQPFLGQGIKPGTLESFEGVYANAYRKASAYVHPTVEGSFGYAPRGVRGEFLGLRAFPPIDGQYYSAIGIHLMAMAVFTLRFCPAEMPAVRRLSRLVAFNPGAVKEGVNIRRVIVSGVRMDDALDHI